MAEQKLQQGSRFVVDLGSVKLPPIIEKQVETDIRGIVLKALAGIDIAARTRLPDSIFDLFPGRTLGLWLDPERRITWKPSQLEPSDHTQIIGEIMTYPFQVLRALGVSKGDPKPTGVGVLRAALDIEEISPFTKERIKAVLEVATQIDESKANIPKRSVARVANLIKGHDIREQVRLLRDAKTTDDMEKGAPAVLNVVASILEDGASSIYSPDFGFHRTIGSGVARKDAVDNIKDADTIGATAGGFWGTYVQPGAGTAAGAVAGGTAASAGAAINELIDWLF